MHDHRHEALEHEGELSSGLAEAALAAAARLFDDRGSQVRRVLDLGCGPGVGTAALVRTFPGATVVAVDSSPAMLERTAIRAAGLGHVGRVETRLLDLDGDLRSLGRCDLAWAAMSIHHAEGVRREVPANGQFLAEFLPEVSPPKSTEDRPLAPESS